MPSSKLNQEEQSAYDSALRRIHESRLEANNSLELISLGVRTLPPEVGHLMTLTVLCLRNNHLTMVPPEIGHLTKLKRLDVRDNQLTTLPSEIGQLTKLKELWLENNHLAELLPEIGQLKALKDLSLENNRLSTLPPEIGQLTALRSLSLHNNHLMTLPSEFGQLRTLTRLFLHGNPGLGMPVEVLGPTYEDVRDRRAKPASPRAILDYYFAKQEQGEAPMQEVRVLLVGRGRSGKTSVLKALRGEQPDKHEPETPGITVLPLDLECPRGTARGHAWDFGGQEFLHGTHQIFLSERCVYLLVLEGRESNWETETDYWLRFIQSFGGSSPVILALNKYDQHAFSVDRFRLQERCPQIVGFVETDAFSGRGIAELRKLLEETVHGMEHVWTGVPKKWHRVKEELKRMPQNFLEYKEYQALCTEFGVAEPGKQDSLAQSLHRLGIALNFREHQRLRETSVLKPQWVTEGIYGLLRFAQKKDCHGVLEWAWLVEALATAEYPPERHGFVLELMGKFEVAFPLEPPVNAASQPPEPTRWLIPELLPEVQPGAFAEFRRPGVKRLRFTYPEALPPGLLPRLIVRTHEMSETHPQWRWRSGVVLEWAGCRALVRLDRQQRRTEVAVIGGLAQDQRSLFDIIRAHLAVLHGKVPVVEEVQALDDPEKWVEMRELRMAEREQDEALKVTVGKEPDARRIKLPVVETLDTVESKEARKAEGPDASPRLRLFVSYAHADARKLRILSTHLTILGRRGYIQPWDDTQLIAGEEWEERVMAELGQADIVLLVYSVASRASQFIQEKEAPKALELARQKECALVVVPLDWNDWDERSPLEMELKMLQAATWNAKPVLDFRPQGKGWQEVEHSIRKAVEQRRRHTL